MTRWTDTTAARVLAGLTYTPRHRASSVRVDVTRVEDDYSADFGRYRHDELPHLSTPPAPRTVDEAQWWADMDASDRMTIVEVAS
jgi:hypothetical protein